MPSRPRAAALIAAAALTLTAADHTPPETTHAPSAVSPAAAIGTAVTAALATPDTSSGVEVGPAKWPLRGSRAGDLALLDRAEQLWRTTPDPAHRPLQGPHHPTTPVMTAVAPMHESTSAPPSPITARSPTPDAPPAIPKGSPRRE